MRAIAAESAPSEGHLIVVILPARRRGVVAPVLLPVQEDERILPAATPAAPEPHPEQT